MRLNEISLTQNKVNRNQKTLCQAESDDKAENP